MNNTTILVVDNDRLLLEFLTTLLQSQGYQVIAASTIEDVRTKLEREQIDLAIIDIHLTSDSDPEDSAGLTFAKELSSSLPTLFLVPKIHVLQNMLDQHRVNINLI